jgi:hypothetical protein
MTIMDRTITRVTLDFPDGITMEQAQRCSILAELATDSGCSEGGYKILKMAYDGPMEFSDTETQWRFSHNAELGDSAYNRKQFDGWWSKLCHVDFPCFYRDILRALKPTLWAQYKREAYIGHVAQLKREEEMREKREP